MKYTSHHRGFGLIEVLVAVSIIVILSSVAMFSFSGARESSRDALRVADIDQLHLALRLYLEESGGDIDCESGFKIDGDTSIVTYGSSGCADSAQIMGFLDRYFDGDIPHDPSGPGDLDYYYYFDGNHSCDTAAQPLLFAVNLESDTSNAAEVCSVVSEGDGGYLRTTSFGGTINPSQPYVKRVYQR